MSVETNCLVNVWFGSSHSFQDEATCKERLDEYNDNIEWIKDRLKALVLMTEPSKFCPEGRDPLSWLSEEADMLIGDLIENVDVRALTREVYHGIGKMFLADGKTAKKGPEDFADAQRIEGDYIQIEGEIEGE